LAKAADLILIAPATANTISKLACGAADSLLAAIVLASRAKVVVCPAMNCQMYRHPATQANLARLQEYGYRVVTPETGDLACGVSGPGRLPDWEVIREALLASLAPQDLAGRRILVTAGPTREPLDPVRYLTNRSSGKMGYALARTAQRRGAQVTLVSGPTPLPPPPGVDFRPVTTAAEMHETVLGLADTMSVVIKAAAVADYRPAAVEKDKIKKQAPGISVNLVRNPDILSELGQLKKRRPELLLVGFAAESRDGEVEGRRKLAEKNCDLMVVNDITAADAGFDVDTNRVVVLDASGGRQELPLLSKEEVADRIWDRVAALLRH